MKRTPSLLALSRMATSRPSAISRSVPKRLAIVSVVFVGLVTVSLLYVTRPALAATCNSTGTGNWNTVGTWTCGHVPVSTDDVNILTGHTISYDGSSTVLSLTTTGTGTLNFNNASNDSLTVTGGLSNSGTVACVNASGTVTHTLNIGGNWTNNGIFTPTDSNDDLNVVLNGVATQTIGGSSATTFNNLTINSGSTAQLTVGVAPVINTTITINGTIVMPDTVTVTNDGSATIALGSTGVIQTADADGVTGAATTSFGSSFTTTSISTNGTVEYNRAGNQAVTGRTYQNLTTSGSGTKTPDGPYTVNNAFTVGSGTTLDESTRQSSLPGGATLTVNGTLDFSSSTGLMQSTSGSTTLTMGAGGLIKTADSGGLGPGAALSLVNNGGTWTTISIETSGTIEYYLTGAQTVTDRNYNNLTITNTGTKTWTLAGTRTVNGNVTLNTGAPFTLAGAQTLNVKGDWTNTNAGTFTPGTTTSTVNFNNTTAAQSINGTAASQTFNNITVNKSGQTLSVGGSTTTLGLNGAMTLAAGTFAAGTATNINVGGDWTNNGGSFTPGSGTVTFNSTGAAQSINGTATSQSFNKLTVSKTGQILSIGGSTTTLTVTDTLSVSAGTFDQGSSDLSTGTAGSISVSSGATFRNLSTGDLTIGSGGVSNAGTITFDGGGGGCGSADSILIRSSSSGTQRAWSGAGTFSMSDVDVQDQAGTAIITVFSGTNTGNNGSNWIFIGDCTGAAGKTYVWVGPTLGNDSWTLSTNWQVANSSPATFRVTPAVTDVLIINGSTTPTPTVSAIPTQTIAALRIINNAFPSFSTTAGNTLTIDPGAGGLGFDVNNLDITGSSGLTIKLNSGTGNVSGTMTVSGGGHRLISNTAGTITFPGGANFTTSTGFTGNAFGNGTAGNGAAGSVVFQSGAIYSHNAGSSPFGATGNPSVVTFQSGSFARYFTATGFDGNGRTYATLEIGKGDPGGVAVTASDSGTGNFQFDNLVINNTGSASSSLTYSGSGTSTITIRGNITSVAAGAGGTAPDVILTAGSGGIVIDKSGGGTVTFGASGNSRSIELEGNATVGSGTTLALARKLLLGIIQPSSFVMTVNGDLTGSASGYLIGKEKRSYTGAATFTYHVGTVNAYSPMDANVTAGTGSLTVAAIQGAQPVLTSSTSLQRYWRLTEGGAITSDMTFYYNDPLDISGNESNYRIIVVESGNATSFPADAEHVFDTANNKFTVLGATEFSDWTAGEPAAPTAIKLTSFTATRDGSEVMLQWHTGFEARNLGFNIYREENGQRTRLTPSLVAGTALMTNRGTVLRAGQDYTWYDHITEVRGQGSEVGDVTYWLEDVDLNGTRTLYGPIIAAPGDSSSKQAGQMRAQLLNEVAQRAPASGVVLNKGPQTLVAPQGASQSGSAEAARSASTSGVAERLDDPEAPAQQKPEPGLTQLDIESMPGIKIAVSQNGWLRVTQPELVAAGLDANVNARKLQLYANAVQVPIMQSGDGMHLTASDYIEFYGHGVESPTETAQTYYLVVGKDSGLRIGVAGPQTIAPPAGAANFAYTIERAERMIYFSGLLNGDAENFFGDVVSSDPITQTLLVSNLDASGAGATLEVTLQGVTNQAHEVRVRMNGADVGTMNFANTSNYSQSFNLAGSAVHEGDNVVELTALGGGEDVSLIDTVRLTYAHAYQTDNNSLAVSINNGNTTRIGGFTNANIRVVDITNQANVIELTQAANINSEMGGTFAVDIQVSGATAGSPHTLLVFTDGQVLHPDLVKHNNSSSWAKYRVGTDFLIITTGDFMASVEPLAQLRRQQGLSVSVVDVEDLYDEFSFGAHSPQAIQDFLEQTTEWKRPPHYVLFVGDASYDPKNYFGQGETDFVPTRLIDTTQMETASDDWFADFDGDGVADMAIGRLPARNAADASTMINKIVSYENATPDPQRGVMLVADNTFEGASDSVRSLLPKSMVSVVINRSSADDATIHDQIIAGLNDGPVVANYFGHGSNGVWTGASLLSSPDAATLTNKNRLSLFLMMTCFNGYFQDPYNDSLSEALLKSQAGAVAVWASTSLTEPDAQEAIDQELYRQLFSGSQPRLGDAVRFAKQATSDSDVRRTWTFFGDPTMRLRRAATQATSTTEKGKANGGPANR